MFAKSREYSNLISSIELSNNVEICKQIEHPSSLIKFTDKIFTCLPLNLKLWGASLPKAVGILPELFQISMEVQVKNSPVFSSFQISP